MNLLLGTLLSVAAGLLLHGLAWLLRRQSRGQAPTMWHSGRATMLMMGAVLAAAFSLLGWSIYSTARVDFDTWAPTTATIITLDTITTEANRGFSFSGQVTEELYYVRLAYTYEVDGQPYEGYQRLPNEMLFDGQYLQLEPDELASIQQKYPEGATVDARYNPADPSEAALESDNDAPFVLLGLGLGLVAGVLSGVFGWGPLQYVLYGRRREPEAGATA